MGGTPFALDYGTNQYRI